MTSMFFTASSIVFCASAVRARATSSSRLAWSSVSLFLIESRPDLSLPTTSVCAAIVGSAVFASFSDCNCRPSATFARLSNRSASATDPDALSSSAFRLAARALEPHSAAASTSSLWSASSIRRLPIVVATAWSASEMLLL